MRKILTQGERWELIGETSNEPTMVLTILNEGKSFPPFRQLVAQAIAENIVAAIDGYSSKPIPSGSDEFEVTKHRIGVRLTVKPENDSICSEVVLSDSEARDLAEKLLRVIR